MKLIEKIDEYLNESIDPIKVEDIKVKDVKGAIEELKDLGITAKRSKKDDEIVVYLKDKKKVVSWMLKNGWTTKKIEIKYPRLVDSEIYK